MAGFITVTTGITVLRAAGRTTEGLAARRRARGPRRRDPFVLLASAPWMLAWAVVETALLAPLALAAAALLVALAIKVVVGGAHPTVAAAAVAGGYAVLFCLGPGSCAARRQLNRFLDPIARSLLTGSVVALMLGAVAVGVIALTVPGQPAFWPVRNLQTELVRLTGASSGECLPPPPAMRLTVLCAAPHDANSPTPRATPADRP